MERSDPGRMERFASVVELYIRATARSLGLPAAELRVLDFGCGTGELVGELRRRGYQAYGVDVDASAVAQGNAALDATGACRQLLQLLDGNGRSAYPDGYFHFVLSLTVFEHVPDVGAVVTEIRRATAPGGGGWHGWPAQFCVVEPHLHMPLVHWLPKNRLRWAWILACSAFGMGSGTEDERCLPTTRAKAGFQYRYSVHETFYRPLRTWEHAFRAAGFRSSVVLPRFDSLRRHRAARLLLTARPIAIALGVLRSQIRQVTLRTELP
jgi:SAM-dependent methyltransferase